MLFWWGGNTFRNWPHPSLPLSPYFKGAPSPVPKWNVVVSHHLDFKFDDDFLSEKKIRPLFFTDRRDPPAGFPFEVVPSSVVTPLSIVQELQKRGIQKLLIEGGGNLIFQFLKANLVDEMHVTLCPKIIGGKGAPSLADGEGFLKNSIKKMKLLHCETAGDEIFLRYGL